MRRSGAALVAVPHRSCGGWSCHGLRDDTVSHRCCSAQARPSGRRVTASVGLSNYPMSATLTVHRVGLLDLTSMIERTIPVTGNPSNITTALSPRYWAKRQRRASRGSVISIVCIATPMVAVRDTDLRRSAPYQRRVNQNPFGPASRWPVGWTGRAITIPQRSQHDPG